MAILRAFVLGVLVGLPARRYLIRFLAGFEQEIRPRSSGVSLPSESPAATRDALIAIKGIGPVVEAALNDAGVYTFEQLAKLTPDEVEARISGRVASARIASEGWIEQARERMRTNRKGQPGA